MGKPLEALADKIDRLAVLIAPDALGRLPAPILAAIDLADDLTPDPDLEEGADREGPGTWGGLTLTEPPPMDAAHGFMGLCRMA